MNHSLLILGAGPTGLGAALQAGELGLTDVAILEASDRPGGLAASFEDEAGFVWDLGSHLQFSHYDKFDEILDLALPQADDWLWHKRSTWVWVCDRFVPYPFQLNLHRLPPDVRWRCVRGLLDAQAINPQANTFAEWIMSTFGEGIAELFLVPYNEKLWATPLHQMSADWIAERIAVPTWESVLKSLCTGEDSTTWGPNATFRYPRRGGTGAVWRAVANLLPQNTIQFHHRVARIDSVRRQVWTQTGECHNYDALISTLPLDHLLKLIDDDEPAPSTPKLAHTSIEVVGLGIAGEPPEELQGKCWMYFPDPDVSFYRATVMSNLSPCTVPHENAWSLMVEVPSHVVGISDQRILDRVIRDLQTIGILKPQDRLLSRWRRHLSHAYPVPTLTRDEALNEILPWLEERNIFSRGRFGAWKYEVSNQDHSLMQGVEVVESLLSGRPELTLFQPGLVNSRHNPFPYAEWVTELVRVQPCFRYYSSDGSVTTTILIRARSTSFGASINPTRDAG